MWNRPYRHVAVFVVGVFLGIAGYSAAVLWMPDLRIHRALAVCAAGVDDKRECLFELIRSEVVSRGVGSGMEVFAKAYSAYPETAEAGCHAYTHRIGDIAYYDLYLTTRDLGAIDFPQSTTACGYGFYHGFIEHITQDHPTADFITRTCEYFKDRLGATMRDIGPICYHGAGHGLMLAQAERVPKSAWGSLRAFAEPAAKECVALSKASRGEVEQCEDGLFTILVQWMEEENYGFSMDLDNPMRSCSVLPEHLLRACYAETSQKLAEATNNAPVEMVRLVKNIPDAYRMRSFGTGVAGFVQSQLSDGQGYEHALEQCLEVESEYRARCIKSVVGGLFEHGAPQEEYKKALALCIDPRVAEQGYGKECFAAVAQRLPRFYEPERRVEICGMFPADHQASCKEVIAR